MRPRLRLVSSVARAAVLGALCLAACPRPAPPGAAPGAAAPDAAVPDVAPAMPDAEAVDAAYQGVSIAYMRGDTQGALTAIREFRARWPVSPLDGIFADWQATLERVGRPAPALDGVRWRDASASYADHPVTLVVFFEPWCPHCQADVPQIELVRRDFADRGLGVVGLTQLSRGSTEADLATFVERGFLGFPIGIEDGSMTEAYGVQGVPHVAFVRGGKIEWEGHPQLLTVDLFEALVSGQALPLPPD